jgi:hypothetical protein
MKYLLTLTLVFSLNAWSVPNSIIAIVNDNIITYSSIANQINKDTTKARRVLEKCAQQFHRIDHWSVIAPKLNYFARQF